jgi:hypothetical protein
MSCRWFRVSLGVAAVLAGMTSRDVGAHAQELPPVITPPPIQDASTIASVVDMPQAVNGSYLGGVTPVSHMTGAGVGCPNCDRWYFALSGGWQERETVHEVGAPTTFIVFDSGFAINAAVGYRFDLFRVESEFSVMNNDCLTAGADGLSSRTDGNVNIRAFMFNVYHDFSLGDWLWQPYVGAGIGIYQSELNGLYPDFFDQIPPQFGFGGKAINATSDFPLAYQFRAGMTRPVGQRSEFFVGYRYFKGEELTFASAPFATAQAHTFHPDGAVIHSLEWGLRVRF